MTGWEKLSTENCAKDRNFAILLNVVNTSLENEIQYALYDFEIQMDNQILVRRPNLVLINKKKNLIPSRFHHSKKKIEESKKQEKFLELARWKKKKKKKCGTWEQ